MDVSFVFDNFLINFVRPYPLCSICASQNLKHKHYIIINVLLYIGTKHVQEVFRKLRIILGLYHSILIYSVILSKSSKTVQ